MQYRVGMDRILKLKLSPTQIPDRENGVSIMQKLRLKLQSVSKSVGFESWSRKMIEAGIAVRNR